MTISKIAALIVMAQAERKWRRHHHINISVSGMAAYQRQHRRRQRNGIA